jgi:hypothetical protein
MDNRRYASDAALLSAIAARDGADPREAAAIARLFGAVSSVPVLPPREA